MLKFSILFIVLTMVFSAFAQESSETSSEGERGFYRREITGFGFLHPNGLGASYRYAERINGYKKRIYSAEITNMKHPKEFKVYNPNFDDTRGFVWGKQYALAILRGSYGIQKVKYTKDRNKGVQFSQFFFIGPSIGMEKPVYLDVRYPNIRHSTAVTETEIFDPEKHNYSNIYGRSPVLTGIEETKLIPGLHFKYAINFEYAPLDDLVRAIEVGISADAFLRPVRMMAFENRRQVFFSLYAGFQFGKKYIE